jgi:hypothetical protein
MYAPNVVNGALMSAVPVMIQVEQIIRVKVLLRQFMRENKYYIHRKNVSDNSSDTIYN